MSVSLSVLVMSPDSRAHGASVLRRNSINEICAVKHLTDVPVEHRGSHHAAVRMSSFVFEPAGSGRVCVPMKPLITHRRTAALHRLKIIQDAGVGSVLSKWRFGVGGANTGAGAQHGLLSAFSVCSGFHREHLGIFSLS